MAKSKYNPDNLLLIGRWVRNGATNKEICDKLGINQNTFYTWIKKYGEFREVLKRTKEIVDTEVEAALFKRALGYDYEEETTTEGIDKYGNPISTTTKYKKHMAPDTGAGIFWLKNRDRENWRDKINHELTGKDGGPVQHLNGDIDISRLTDEELTILEKCLNRPDAGSDTKGKGEKTPS